jgi:hypothetical protein
MAFKMNGWSAFTKPNDDKYGKVKSAKENKRKEAKQSYPPHLSEKEIKELRKKDPKKVFKGPPVVDTTKDPGYNPQSTNPVEEIVPQSKK